MRKDIWILAVFLISLLLVMACGDGDDTDSSNTDGDDSIDGDWIYDGDDSVDGDWIYDGDDTVDGDQLVTDGDDSIDGDQVATDGDDTIDGDTLEVDVSDSDLHDTDPIEMDAFDDDDDPVQGTWHDSSSGLPWSNTLTEPKMYWGAAKEHCNAMSLGGHSDWRLPNISELRSLIRGCAGTATGGYCGVTDSCIDISCQGGVCYDCSAGDGPADNCYWPDSMEGSCGSYWSSSPVGDLDGSAWLVNFYDGHVYNYLANDDSKVRCVR